jgi:hypothetical protein
MYPQFLCVAEQYGLQNTTCLYSNDVASGAKFASSRCSFTSMLPVCKALHDTDTGKFYDLSLYWNKFKYQI